MKSLIRIFAAVATLIFVLVAVIKYVQQCTWKEAVGILEEFWNEIKENCCCCCDVGTRGDKTSEGA